MSNTLPPVNIIIQSDDLVQVDISKNATQTVQNSDGKNVKITTEIQPELTP